MAQWEAVPLNDLSGKGPQWTERTGPGGISRDSSRSLLRGLTPFSNHDARTMKDRFFDFWKGWRTGIAFCIVISSVVLVLNVVLATLAQLNKTRNFAGVVVQDGLSTFHEGSCETTKNISFVTHLFINILSTILLQCSNHCMQILASPTRDEIDAAHRKQKWLRIGVPNFQNLAHVDWKRTVLCIMLAVTSLPLHLLWNSSVVQTVSSNDFFVGGVTANFADGINATATSAQFIDGWFQGDPQDFDDVWFDAMRGDDITHLTASDCITAYGVPMVQKYRNVALVFDVENTTNSLLFAGTHLTGADEHGKNGTVGLGDSWVCGLPSPFSTTCEVSSLVERNGSYWTPLSAASDWKTLASNPYVQDVARSNTSVTGCLAQTVDSKCRIGTTPAILYVVAAANAMKVFCFLCTWFLTSHRPRRAGEELIVTNGDLIASYLREPDRSFAGRCLASARLVRDSSKKRSHDNIEVEFWDFGQSMPLQWLGGQSQRQRKTTGDTQSSRYSPLSLFKSKRDSPTTKTVNTAPRWHTGPSGVTWLTYILPSGLCIVALIALFFAYGLDDYLFLDFGQSSTQATVSIGEGSGPGQSLGVLRSTLLANAPQLAATYVFVACNSVLTSMLAHYEISSYAIRRRGLRVSFPKRKTAQRGMYFLQAPWKIAIPLMITSTVLHWCLSQSLFVLRVAVHNPNGDEDLSRLISTVGYSAGPILASLGLLAFFIIGVCALSWFKKYNGAEHMPLIANCSAALAAATCPPLYRLRAQGFGEPGEDPGKRPTDRNSGMAIGLNIDTAYSSQLSIMQEPGMGVASCISEQSLMWGELFTADGKTVNDDVGHAGFSPGPVEPIKVGNLYA